jgi:2-dehydropantoate 2-reductase
VVVGAGAVGSYYGALLARAGHEVRFVLRRDLNAVRERGLRITSPRGDFTLPDVHAFASSADAGIADWVICSLKSTALDVAEPLLRPSVGPRTRIVALMNGLGVEQRIAGWFGAERVFGAMAFVCINRGEPGVVHHLDYGRVTVGHLEDDPGQAEELRALFAGGGIEVTVAPSLRAARWEKLCWNIPFNGLSVAAGGVGTQAILGDPGLRQIAEEAMREVVSIANADLAATGSPTRFDPDDVVRQMFAQTEAMGDYRTSMVIDYVMGRPLEVDAILGEPVRRAEALGVAAPVVRALSRLVGFADQRNRGAARLLTQEDLDASSV